MTPPSTLAIDLDGVLGDTRRLWDDWLADAGRVLGVDPGALPADRGEAAALLDRGGGGNWRTLLERFAEDRAPVYLRPTAEVSSALRRLAAAGTHVGVFTDAPEQLAHIALAQLGAARRIDAVETGSHALERLLETLGSGTVVVRSREESVEQISRALGRNAAQTHGTVSQAARTYVPIKARRSSSSLPG